MMHSDYFVSYPNSIGLREPLKRTGSASKKKQKKIIEAFTSGALHTYRETKKGINVITYEENYIPKVNELSFAEYCRTHYILNNYETCKIYINFENCTMTTVLEGIVTSYSKWEDEGSLTDAAKKEEKAKYAEGLKAGFLFDKYVEAFEGEKYPINDRAVFKKVVPSQVLRTVSLSGLKLSEYSSRIKKTITIRNIFLTMSGAILIGSGYLMYHKIDNVNNELNRKLSELSADVHGLNMSIEQVAKKAESSSSDNESLESTKRGIVQIMGRLNAINSSLNELKRDEKASDEPKVKPVGSDVKTPPTNSGEAKNLAVVKKTPILKYFMCKPLLITDESVMCMFKGAKFTITETPQRISGSYVSYLPKERSFLTESRGARKVTPISIAERGFE